MTYLRQRFIEDLKLKGFSERTQECYVYHVAKLAKYYHTSPDKLTHDQIRQYFLYMRDVKHYSECFFKQGLSAVKYFFQATLRRPLEFLDFVLPRKEKKLPDILTKEEVQNIIAHTRLERYRVCFATIYSLGLRLGEGTSLHVADIDSKRMLVHIHHGKGAKDRFVPLPQRTLELLRNFWKTHRNPVLLFPAPGRGRGGFHLPATTTPMPYASVQTVFKKVVKGLGIRKRVSIHSLRHSYAAHLVESGVHLRSIQTYLGHNSPVTTALYTQLSSIAHSSAHQTIHELMQNL